MSGAAAHLERLRGWMAEQGWQSLEHQERAWRARLEGQDGLISVPTGTGKTYAAFFGALALEVGRSAAHGCTSVTSASASSRLFAVSGLRSRRQRAIRGNRSATPLLCRVDRAAESKCSSNTCLGST